MTQEGKALAFNPDQHYFFRATILDHESYIVGLPDLSTDRDDRIWRTVRDYGKMKPKLELTNPDTVFDFAKHIGMVSFSELRVYRQTSSVWNGIADSCILIQDIHSPMRGETPQRIQNLSLGRLEQLVLDFPAAQKVDTILD